MTRFFQPGQVRFTVKWLKDREGTCFCSDQYINVTKLLKTRVSLVTVYYTQINREILKYLKYYNFRTMDSAQHFHHDLTDCDVTHDCL